MSITWGRTETGAIMIDGHLTGAVQRNPDLGPLTCLV